MYKATQIRYLRDKLSDLFDIYFILVRAVGRKAIPISTQS